MTDFNFRKPTSGKQIKKAAPRGTKISLYSDLSSDPRPAYQVLADLPRNNIILIQNPQRMNTGHWVSLSFHPESREIFFFSSYGGKPDEEKNIWIPAGAQERSRQRRNVLNDGLKYFAQRGWTIHYNDVPYQVVGDDSATCGIWASAFLRSGRNPDYFGAHHSSVEDYYARYF